MQIYKKKEIKPLGVTSFYFVETKIISSRSSRQRTVR